MGNASRVFAIAQALAKQSPGVEIHFFSWGKGYEFLERAIREADSPFHLGLLLPYPWSAEGRSPLSRFSNMLVSYARAFAKNTMILRAACRSIRPDFVILDSDYHFFAFFPRRQKRMFFLGQAIDVVERAKDMGYRPLRLASRLSFWACEKLDGMIQQAVSDKVFVPSFLEREDPETDERALRVPLIVREEFRTAGRRVARVKSIGVSSGSGIESDRFTEVASSVGGAMATPADSLLRLTHPWDFQEAELVVVQGGLSSISECIALKRPMLVVPIRGRAEQEVNARTVERLGLGVSLENKDWRNALEQGGSPGVEILVHGADVIARHIFADA